MTDRDVGQLQVAAAVVFARKHGDFVLFGQLAHQLHPVGLGAAKAVAETIDHKGNAQTLGNRSRRVVGMV